MYFCLAAYSFEVWIKLSVNGEEEQEENNTQVRALLVFRALITLLWFTVAK